MKKPSVVIDFNPVALNSVEEINKYLTSPVVKKHEQWVTRIHELIAADIADARETKEITSEEEKYHFELSVICALTKALLDSSVNVTACIKHADIHPITLVQKSVLNIWEKDFDPPQNDIQDLLDIFKKIFDKGNGQ